MSAVLGIDLGLSSVRAAVVTRDGRLIGRGRAAQPPLVGRGGRAERTVSDWTTTIPVAVGEALRAAGSPRIEAIGIGALGPCPVMLGSRLEPLNGVPLFSLEGGAETERQALLAGTTIPAHRLGPDHVIPRLRLWQRERADQFGRATTVVDATGYLVAWLTGRVVMDPATLVDHRCVGLEQPLPLPEILAADAIAGGLRAGSAQLLGLPEGTPVAVGTYDSFADLAGAGVVAPGDAGILLGSTVVLGAVVSGVADEARIAGAGLRVSPHVGDGALVGGWTSTGGSLLDWSAKTMPPDRDGTAPQRLPGSTGLIALPYFAGERAPIWDAGATGAILGLTLSTTASDLHQALTEAVALSVLDLADRLEPLAGNRQSFRASGGGLRNAAWAQATADALGCRLETVEHAGEAIGPATLALRCIGIFGKPRIAAELRPDPRHHARYRELLAIYRRLFPALKDCMHDIRRLTAEKKELA